LDKLDSALLVRRWDAVYIELVRVIPGTVSSHQRVMTYSMSSVLQRVMTQHHPYDEIRVAQVGWQRVTIWKNVCLLFWSRGANHSEGSGSGKMLMGGVKMVCMVCVK
jgi:hypothetical protein